MAISGDFHMAIRNGALLRAALEVLVCCASSNCGGSTARCRDTIAGGAQPQAADEVRPVLFKMDTPPTAVA